MDRASLQSRLIRGVLLPSISIFMALFGIVCYNIKLSLNEVLARQQLIVFQIVREAELYFTDSERMLRSISGSLKDWNAPHISDLVQNFKINYPRIISFLILDENGFVRFTDDDSKSVLGFDYSRERFFQLGKDSPSVYISNPVISLSTNFISITAAIPLYESENFMGMVAIELSLSQLQRNIKSVSTGKQNLAYIIDSTLTVIIHPNERLVQERWNLHNHPLIRDSETKEQTARIYFKEDQGVWFIGSMKKIQRGWFVIAEQPLFAAARPIIILGVIIILTFILSLILILILQLKNFHSIHRSIKALVYYSDIISKGDYSQTVISNEQRFSEFHSLEISFNRMVENIKERDRFLENRVAKRTRELSEAIQIQNVLFREVNHRVKNNLTSIISLINKEYDRSDEQGKEDVLSILKNLKNRIEGLSIVHSLMSCSGWKPLNLTSLCKEIVNGVLFNLPSGYRIDVEIEGDEVRINSDQAHNLALVINELSTNTMKYAIKPDRKNKIQIALETDEESNTMIYRDSGDGFSKQVLQGDIGNTHLGIGLINGIVKRSLGGHIQLSNDSGACVIICWPKTRESCGRGYDER